LNDNADLQHPADTRQQRNRLLLLALCGIAPLMVNGLVNSLIAHNALLYWGFEILTWIVIPSTILLLVIRTAGVQLSDLGYHCSYHGSFRGQADIGLVLLACAVFAPLCYGVYYYSYDFFSSLFPGQGFFRYESIVPESGILYFAVIIYFALSAGLVEEFLFRGLLYRAFSGFRHSLGLFLVISPILFSLVHWEDGLANLASTYIVGVFMAIAYLGLRNLWPLVIGHIFTNLVWFG
jgi:membrane protease YdiL (CAAX protease family)